MLSRAQLEVSATAMSIPMGDRPHSAVKPCPQKLALDRATRRRGGDSAASSVRK
jgi:hypothetical protein